MLIRRFCQNSIKHFQKHLIFRLVLVASLFLLILLFHANTPGLGQTLSPDAIAVRVIPNPSHYSARSWYYEQKFNGSPQSLSVDGYEAVRDGRTVYVNAANISGGHLYTNIYVISYNQKAESATVDIFGNILSNWKFNTDMAAPGFCYFATSTKCFADAECPGDDYCTSQKAEVTRDTRRLADLSELSLALAGYYTHNSNYPNLTAGSYLPNKTLSTWPSWQQTLGQALGTPMPQDPINELGPCPGFTPDTCWNENRKIFYTTLPALPAFSRVYQYNAAPDGLSYGLCAVMESGLVTGAPSCSVSCSNVCNGVCTFGCGSLDPDCPCSGGNVCCGQGCSAGNDSDCSPVCGNHFCDVSEDCASCSFDCGACPAVCGNNICEPGEDCSSCPGDCTICGSCPDSSCDTASGECSLCPADCSPTDCCGNGNCDAAVGENNGNCSSDCAYTCIDNDNDGYGTCPNCDRANGCAQDGNDCDDSAGSVYPGAPGVCDGRDNDCDTIIDNGCDSDGDHYCGCGHTFTYGSDLSGTCPSTNATGPASLAASCDCDDGLAAVHPNAPEVCGNSFDENCNGATDCADTACIGDPNCCFPDGCSGICSIGCSSSQDPDCGCIDSNGCCGEGCDNSVDNDCPLICVPDGTCNNICPPGCTALLDPDCDPNGCCGDGITNGSEQCDDNGTNGQPCAPGYGGTCTYCSNICTSITLSGPYCGDGACDGLYGENTSTCTTDCPIPCAPDGCNGSCPANCTAAADPDCTGTGCCGDGTCNGSEDYGSCPGDCPVTCTDNDHDGHDAIDAINCPSGDDCNDSDPQIYPGNTELCDGKDNDCDSSTADGSGQSPPPNTKQSGICAGSTQICTGGAWTDDYSGVSGYEDPEVTCNDAVDNDCDSLDDCNDTDCAVFPACMCCTFNFNFPCKLCGGGGPLPPMAEAVPPVVSSFSVTVGSAIISWSVSDSGGSHLDRIEIWRAPDVGGSPGTWQEVTALRQTLTAQNTDTNSGTVTENPAAGTYWYGLHVFDQAGNVTYEPNPPGPIKITVPPSATCTDGTPYNTCASNAPWYCNGSGNLVENCSLCNCRGIYICSIAGTFCCDNICDNNCAVAGCTAAEDPDCAGTGCCGDSTCDPGENSTNCPGDCGACTPTCTTGPGCRTAALTNGHTTATVCCGAGESCYDCNAGYTWNGSTCTAAVDTVNPIVTAFDVQPRTTTGAVTATYSVTDNTALARVELWRTDDSGGTPNAANWQQVQSQNVSGTSASGNFTDTPANGTWWYGLHVFDQAGNTGYEPSPPGPIQVVSTLAPTATIDINGNTTYQTIDGWGIVHYPNWNWEGPNQYPIPQQDVMNQIKNDLGIDVIFNYGTNPVPVNPSDFFESFEKTNDDNNPTNYNWTSYDSQFAPFGYVFDRLKIQKNAGLKVAVMPLAEPAWLTDSGGNFNPAVANAYNELAELFGAFSQYSWNNYGINIDYYSIQREPTYSNQINGWCGYSPGELTQAIKSIGQKLRGEGFSSVMIAPDDSNSADTRIMSQTILPDAAAKSYMSNVSYHPYDGFSGRDGPDMAIPAMTALANDNTVKNSGFPLWLTEWSFFLAYGDRLEDHVDELRFALDNTKMIYNAHVYGNTSLFSFWTTTYGWGSDIDGNGKTAPGNFFGPGYIGNKLNLKKFAQMQTQYSRYVRPGTVRIAATVTNAANVFVTAYYHPTLNQFTIEALNKGTTDETAQIKISNLSGITSLNVIRTSATENTVNLGQIAVSGNTFTYYLPKESLTTFTSMPYAPDLTPPRTSSFNVSFNSGTNNVDVTWNVSDNQALKRVELWRTSDISSRPDHTKWQSVGQQTISGTSRSGTFTDSPADGTYWYGIHVIDQMDNTGTEPNPPGPIQVVKTSAGDTQNPVVTAFDVQPRTTTGAVTASYSVTDNTALARVELWRTDDSGGAPNAANWQQVQTRNVSGTSANGSFTDTPTNGTWWYGLHVFDQAGNTGYEPSPPGSIQVVSTPAPTATVNINGSIAYQTIEGWGVTHHVIGNAGWNPYANGWPGGLTEAQVMSQLHDDMGITHIENFANLLFATHEATNDDNNPNNYNWTSFNSQLSGLSYVFQRLQAQQNAGIKIGITSHNKAPWLYGSGDYIDTSNPDIYTEFAENWAALLLYARNNYGVNFDSIGLQIEPSMPQATWLHFTGTQLRDAIKAVGAKLASEGFSTTITTPDDLNTTQSRTLAQTILADTTARGYVSHIGYHMYDGGFPNGTADNCNPGIGNLYSAVSSYNKPLWMTEWAYVPSGATDLDRMLQYTKAIYNLHVNGYGTNYFLWISDSPLSGGNESLWTGNVIGGKLEYKKFAHAYTQYSKYVRPGAQRLNVSVSGAANVFVTAYKHTANNQFTIEALNKGTTDETATINLNNITAASLNIIRTSATENTVNLGQIAVSGNSFTYLLPKESITTFTTY